MDIKLQTKIAIFHHDYIADPVPKRFKLFRKFFISIRVADPDPGVLVGYVCSPVFKIRSDPDPVRRSRFEIPNKIETFFQDLLTKVIIRYYILFILTFLSKRKGKMCIY